MSDKTAKKLYPEWGNRADGTSKGKGFLGVLRRPDGKVSTEISVGVDWGDGETEIPTLVPTLDKDEVRHLLDGGPPTPAILRKAIAHARGRIRKGLSSFYQEGEE